MFDFATLANLSGYINSNKIMWGVSMLMLNFGARYVVADLGKAHEVILSHEITKKLIVLCLFFVATRDILMSFILTVAYIVVIDGILHEKRRFCLVPKSIIETATAKQHTVSKDDYLKARDIINRYETNKENDKEVIELNKKTLYMNYVNNIKMASL
jgi:hypothetical protein